MHAKKKNALNLVGNCDLGHTITNMYRIAIEEFGKATATNQLTFELESSTPLSVRELIHRTVAREIEIRGVQMDEKELAKHQKEATRAFVSGTFAMLVAGEPMTALEHLMTATDESEILFIRILPLVGG